MENHELSDLERRLIDWMCLLLGELVEAQSAHDTRAFVSVERRFQDLGEVAGNDLFRVFAREALNRIGEASPEAAKKILKRLSTKAFFGGGLELGEERRG
jgi:hypothetical protein